MAKQKFKNSVQLTMMDYEELEKPLQGTVKGTIPDWLDGSLFRNGPGLYNFGGTSYNHIFDGMAMIQKFKIKDGNAAYHRRFLRSEVYEKNMAAKRIVVSTFGTLVTPDPSMSVFKRFKTRFFPNDSKVKDNCVVNIFPVKDSLMVATETEVVREVNPDTLETLPGHCYTDYVGLHSATAHPHYDPDGTVYNIGIGVDKGPVYKIISIPPSAKGNTEEKPLDGAKVLASVPARWKMNPSIMHSFCMSENYFILIEQPLCLNMMSMMTHTIRHVPMVSCMKWYGDHPTRFLVVDKKTGKLVNAEYTYVTDKLMMFHQGNAYEEDGHLVLDVCGGDDGSFVADTSDMAEQELEPIYGRRYILPLNLSGETKVGENLVTLEDSRAAAVLRKDKTVNCTYDSLGDMWFDHPMINYKYNAKKYRYLYGVGFGDQTGKTDFTMWLMKTDLSTRNIVKWEEEGCFPSEGIFVESPDAVDEDDGVILSAVMDQGNKDRSFLLVLDAKTFTELGRVEFETTFPKDFHGSYIKSGRLRKD